MLIYTFKSLHVLKNNNTDINHVFKGFERGKEDISQTKDESSLSMSKSKVSILLSLNI